MPPAVAAAGSDSDAHGEEGQVEPAQPLDVDVYVKGPERGRWRIGRHFTPEGVVIPAGTITHGQLGQLIADPTLTVLPGPAAS
jgi:hypothetical protein